VFLAFDILALIAGTIRPRLVTVTVLLIFSPVAFIASAIKVRVNTKAMSLVIFPEAVIDISVGMNEAAFAIGFVVSPPALVHRAIRPYLYALTLSDTGISKPVLRLFEIKVPKTLVFCTVFEDNHFSVLNTPCLLLLTVIKISQLFSDCLNKN
jgi:hypothetical protein